MEKTDEIAKINESELSKVENNLLNAEQLKFLFAKTPKQHTYKRPGKGGSEWTYVTGVYIKKVLNLITGWAWDFTVENFDVNLTAKQTIVLGKLVIRTGGKEIIKMQFGRADIKFKTETRKDEKGNVIMKKDNYGNMKPQRFPTDMPMDLGNDLKAATTDSLKKCASELGIASDIYGAKEFKEIQIISESEKSDTEKAQRKIIDALDTYQGEDKKEIQELCQNKVKSGEFDMTFAQNIAKQINLEL